MKKTKLITTISVALLASLALSAPSYAKRNDGAAVAKPSPEVVLPESQAQRHKTMHAARKAAAKRMKTRMLKVQAKRARQQKNQTRNGAGQ